MDVTEQIQAMMPDLINGKTHRQLEEELVTYDRSIGCHVVDGVKFPFYVPRSNLEALKTFEVRDNDVFVITYPKSGTHWMGEILHFILHEGKGDFDRSFMAYSLECTLVGDQTKLDSVTPGYKAIAAMKSPRCILTHCLERFRPPQLLSKNAKVVYVARNPKDVLKSWLHNVDMAPQWTFDEKVWAFCQGKCKIWQKILLLNAEFEVIEKVCDLMGSLSVADGTCRLVALDFRHLAQVKCLLKLGRAFCFSDFLTHGPRAGPREGATFLATEALLVGTALRLFTNAAGKCTRCSRIATNKTNTLTIMALFNR